MAATTIETPARTVEQRRMALRSANRIRMFRARLKERVAAGEQKVTPLLVDPDDDLLSMKVQELLLAIPHWGWVKVNKVLMRTSTSPSKTVGGLSDRQRDELIRMLGGR